MSEAVTGVSRESVSSRVKSIISEHLDVELDKVIDTATFHTLGADSLDGVELTMCFEEEYDLAITDEEAFKLEDKTIGDTIDFLMTKVNA